MPLAVNGETKHRADEDDVIRSPEMSKGTNGTTALRICGWLSPLETFGFVKSALCDEEFTAYATRPRAYNCSIACDG
jgi:hypothetical protein